jgi:hypothetical protein
VPKTLIFAKDDSHADDVVQIIREEFGKRASSYRKRRPTSQRVSYWPSSSTFSPPQPSPSSRS